MNVFPVGRYGDGNTIVRIKQLRIKSMPYGEKIISFGIGR
jgi:hypothetical protein